MKQVQTDWGRLAEGLRERDERLRPFIDRIGPPVIHLEADPFRALARSILSQQLATGAARAIISRFAELSPPFPQPGEVNRMRTSTFRRVGVSAAKANYLKALAKQWADPVWRRGWNRLDDAALVERLTEVKGVGEWTAHMFLIFSLGRPDVLPVGDYGVRKGIQLVYGLSEPPHPKRLAELVPHWSGASSVAAWYLWRVLDQKLV